MRALIALLAAAVLLGVVWVGVGLAGQQYLFGIVIPYVNRRGASTPRENALSRRSSAGR